MRTMHDGQLWTQFGAVVLVKNKFHLQMAKKFIMRKENYKNNKVSDYRRAGESLRGG